MQVTLVAARSDGSLVGVYGEPDQLYYRIRSSEGTWSDRKTIAGGMGGALSEPQLARGTDDTVHFAYMRRDGTAWYRRIRPDGSLTSPRRVSSNLGTTVTDVGSVLPLVHLPEMNTTVLLYRRADGTLWARRADTTGRLSPPVQVTERAVAQGAAREVLQSTAWTRPEWNSRVAGRPGSNVRPGADTAATHGPKGRFLMSTEEAPPPEAAFPLGGAGNRGRLAADKQTESAPRDQAEAVHSTRRLPPDARHSHANKSPNAPK